MLAARSVPALVLLAALLAVPAGCAGVPGLTSGHDYVGAARSLLPPGTTVMAVRTGQDKGMTEALILFYYPRLPSTQKMVQAELAYAKHNGWSFQPQYSDGSWLVFQKGDYLAHVSLTSDMPRDCRTKLCPDFINVVTP